MSAQPEALRLAEALHSRREPSPTHYINQAAAELRRLHDENEQLRQALLTLHETQDMTAKAGAAHARTATDLQAAVKRLHAARGRYHTQLAACDLFDLCGLPNERPKK